MDINELNTAISALENAVSDATKPALARLYFERGRWMRSHGDNKNAFEDLQRAIALDATLAEGFEGTHDNREIQPFHVKFCKK